MESYLCGAVWLFCYGTLCFGLRLAAKDLLQWMGGE